MTPRVVKLRESLRQSRRISYGLSPSRLRVIKRHRSRQGAITFAPASLNQVAQVYAEFIGCKLEFDPRSTLPDDVIKFQNQTPLNKEECAHALETRLSWQGAKVIPAAQDLARLVPVSESAPGQER